MSVSDEHCRLALLLRVSFPNEIGTKMRETRQTVGFVDLCVDMDLRLPQEYGFFKCFKRVNF
jgi:hypothetical protein